MSLSIISDMDGVIYRGKQLIPGAADFVKRLISANIKFIFLTNNSEQTPLDLKLKLHNLGIMEVTEENFITSAMATAIFLKNQLGAGTAYVIGGAGLTNEIYKAGLSLTEHNPDYVVVGKTRNLNYEMIDNAVNFIHNGSKFIATNPDVVNPIERGLEPDCGSIIAAIEKATEVKPYIIGKPNSLMMMIAKNKLGARSAETVMIGDRMDTDIRGGLEAGMQTCLVLSGVSTKETLKKFSYKPDYIFNNIGEINPEIFIK